MKDLPKDFDLLNYVGLLQPESTQEPLEFFFDDEPLERILYGEDTNGPTRANFFLPALTYKQKIVQAYRSGNIQETLAGMSEFGKKGYQISTGTCFELAFIIKGIVPQYPNPIISFDLMALHPLIEQIWDLALKRKDKELQDIMGTSLYHWYEHQKRFEDARQVLMLLIENGREKGNRLSEGISINNFAFEYYLEGRHKEAIPLFEDAANIFREIGDTFDFANARANYWTCQLECASLEDIEKMETELESLEKILKNGSWHARKPLILRAKIEERRGNIDRAISFVEWAIGSSKESKTRYPELDSKYLESLKGRFLCEQKKAFAFPLESLPT